MANDNPWSAATLVPDAGADSREPALAVIGDTLHLAWNRNKTLYHAVFDGNVWSAPVRIASGEQPALAVTPDGRLHCLFTHKFIGNYEVYHVFLQGGRWSLPEPVSRTPGISTDPAVAVAPDGSLHAAWADTTPGESTIYYGTLDGLFWTSSPIPSGRGALPTIAITSTGDIHVAWQDRTGAAGRYDILSATLDRQTLDRAANRLQQSDRPLIATATARRRRRRLLPGLAGRSGKSLSHPLCGARRGRLAFACRPISRLERLPPALPQPQQPELPANRLARGQATSPPRAPARKTGRLVAGRGCHGQQRGPERTQHDH